MDKTRYVTREQLLINISIARNGINILEQNLKKIPVGTHKEAVGQIQKDLVHKKLELLKNKRKLRQYEQLSPS